ncbi:type II toxin-antitoxin system RelE family toxin [Congregibacter sp.]|uniref:type II toxin-antitoxin system RelE family toxin n=1 Tax=Congregibacter sp. TaxID=2744308 RepID=UPI003F6D6E95
MARYSLTFKKSVTKDLRAIPTQDLSRILQKIEALADDPRPHGCTKLSAQERYRVPQGQYRIVYEVRESVLVVHVLRVAHRGAVYRRN